MKKLISIFILILLLNSCLDVKKDKVNDFMNNYFTIIKSKDFNKIIDFCSEDLLKNTEKDKVINILTKVNEKLGDFENYELTNWTVKNYFGTKNSGKYYTLTYKVKYKKYEAIETYVVFNKLNTVDYKLNKFNINSDGLLN